MKCVVGVALKNSKRLQEKERQRERENKSCFENTKEFYFLSVEFLFFLFFNFSGRNMRAEQRNVAHRERERERESKRERKGRRCRSVTKGDVECNGRFRSFV